MAGGGFSADDDDDDAMITIFEDDGSCRRLGGREEKEYATGIVVRMRRPFRKEMGSIVMGLQIFLFLCIFPQMQDISDQTDQGYEQRNSIEGHRI